MAGELEVRRARLAERDEVLAVANAAFSTEQHAFDFRSLLPWAWNDERVADHWVCCIDGRIVGVVGVYPFAVCMGDVVFNAAGLGQVATLPEARGHGVMSSLLSAATAQMDDGRYDFTWLWGDRQRYGRFGWARGGATYIFESFDKYLPPPPAPEEVRPLDGNEGFARFYDCAMAQPYAVLFCRCEFRQLLDGAQIATLGYRDAWVVYSPSKTCPKVLLADGPVEEVSALLSHLARQVKEEGEGWRVACECGPFDSPLMRACRQHYWKMHVAPAASFRICNLVSYFTSICESTDGVTGSDELSLRNSDTGQELRIVCTDGRFEVSDVAGPDVREMSTTALSEAVFGLLPLDTTLPGLTEDSPIRTLLERPAHISHLYSL
jgi:predicted N-acetyltransferase YhbS